MYVAIFVCMYDFELYVHTLIQGFIKHVVYGWLCMYCMVIFSIRMQCMVYLFPYMYGLRMACMTYIFRHTCMDYRHVFLICLTTPFSLNFIITVFKMVEIDVDHATQKTHNKNTNDRQSRDI